MADETGTSMAAIPTDPADVQATFAATLVDEWVRCGVRHAVVCPGSRSTPLALALAERAARGAGDLRLHVHHDERSGAFLALGLGVATGRPAVVLTTSGTAAVELHPAVVEADLAGVPLLACTADRPPELRDVGAPQAIDQLHLFGRSVRWFADPGVAEPTTAARWRALAARAVAEAIGDPPGPVHLNLPFREPLVGTPGPLPAARDRGAWVRRMPTGAAADLPAALVPGRRGVVVAGVAPVDGITIHRLASLLGWPVLADPRSSAWGTTGSSSDARVVSHLDALLRAPAAAALRPDVVLRIGGPPASRVVNEWLAAAGADEIVAGAPGWSDPAATAATVVHGDAGGTLRAWVDAVVGGEARGGGGGRGDHAATGEWLARWRRAGDAAAEAVREALDDLRVANEPGVARDVVAALPDGAGLVVSSSMPIRDVERYAAPRPGVRIVSNRGANGIDGVLSTAVGVALGTGAPTALLVGDVAFLHDVNGLLGAADRGIDLTCVVVDNDGGGIFSFLPQAGVVPPGRFEALFGTPHGLDLVDVARAHGAPACAIEGHEVSDAVRESVVEGGGLRILVVRTDRAANVDIHRLIDDAVVAAVDRALG